MEHFKKVSVCLPFFHSSKVVVTLLILVILLDSIVVIFFVLVVNSLIFIRVFVWLEPTNLLIVSWLPLTFAKSILSLSHLVVIVGSEHGVLVFSFVIENFFFFSLLLLGLKFIYDFLLQLSSVRVL